MPHSEVCPTPRYAPLRGMPHSEAGMLTRPQPHEAEAEATTHEAEATTHEAEAKTHLEILIIITVSN